MEKRKLDKKRLSVVITTIALLLLFIALLTIPIIKLLDSDLGKCIDRMPRVTEMERGTKSTKEIVESRSFWCKSNGDNLSTAYNVQTYSFWFGILLLLIYWLGIPLIIKFYNYLFPSKKDGSDK